MIPYIQLEGITKNFGDLSLYKNLNMTLFEGQRVALLAKNGAGKTTLLNIISHIDTPDSGTVTYRNDLRVGYLQQEPSFADNITVLDAVYHSNSEIINAVRDYESALLSGKEKDLGDCISRMDMLGAWDYDQKAKNILSKLKITDLDQKVSTLSGGQRKRLALAALLIEDYDVLIMDEPTNHLDLDMVEWLEDYLLTTSQALLLITHDRYFLDRVSTDIYEIDGGELYSYNGGYSDYIVKRDERIMQFNSTVDKAQNLYRRELEWMRRMPQARGTKAKYRKDAFYEIKDVAFSKRDDSSVNINVKSSRLGTKIFEAKGVSKSFGDKVILKDFEYTFTRYEKLGIIGDNGSGKSTFLNILTGSVNPDSGVIDIGDSVKFGYYCQTGITFDESMKVIDYARNIAEVVSMGDGSTISVSQFLNHFLFPPKVQHNFIYKLSGGEKRRLYLLSILMQSPNFLILDEPTNDLDIMTLNVLENYLEDFGGCVIIVSHDRYFMDKVVDHLLVFEGDGKIRNFPGNYTQYRNTLLDEQENTSQPKQTKAPLSTPEIKKDRPRKMSFKERQEYDRLTIRIDELEKEKKQIEDELSSGSLSNDDLIDKSEKISAIISELDDSEIKWLELSELAK